MANSGGTLVRVRDGAKAVAKHPATHYTAGAGGIILALMAWLSPIVNAGTVSKAVEEAPSVARQIAKDAADAAVKPLGEKVDALGGRMGSVEVKVDKLTTAITGDPLTGTDGVNAKIRRIEEALTRMAMPR